MYFLICITSLAKSTKNKLTYSANTLHWICHCTFKGSWQQLAYSLYWHVYTNHVMLTNWPYTSNILKYPPDGFWKQNWVLTEQKLNLASRLKDKQHQWCVFNYAFCYLAIIRDVLRYDKFYFILFSSSKCLDRKFQVAIHSDTVAINHSKSRWPKLYLNFVISDFWMSHNIHSYMFNTVFFTFYGRFGKVVKTDATITIKILHFFFLNMNMILI